MRIPGYQMTAVGKPLALAERDVPDALPSGRALVRVIGCGVCHTDLGFLDDGVPTRHPLPLVLGHEVSGRVLDAGPGADRALVGRNVIVPAVMPCGTCDPCRRGRGDICRAQVFPGNDDHGGFASHLVVPADGLCPIDLSIDDPERLARLSVIADAVSTAYDAVTKANVGDGDFALFVGIGGVGGFGVQIAKALGARVLALDVDDARLARMSEHGADWTMNVRDQDPRAVKKAARGIAKEHRLPDTEWKVFETSGTGPGQELAFSLLNHGALLSVVGFHPGAVNVRLSNLMALAARAEGTWGCPPAKFPAVLDLVLTGKVAVDPFVELFPMSEVTTVFDRLRRHELTRRPVLVPDFSERN